MSLQSIALATDKIVRALEEEEEYKRAALGKFRRAIQIARADDSQFDDTRYTCQLEELESIYMDQVADIAQKKAMEHSANRIALLSTPTRSTPTNQPASADQLLSKSRQTNDSLLRTRDIIVQELQRVTEVGAVLKDDTEKLRDTGKELNDYASSLQTSGGMIKNLQRREATDRMLVYFGFAFLLLIAAFIVYRRLRHLFSPVAWLLAQTSSWWIGDAENEKEL